MSVSLLVHNEFYKSIKKYYLFTNSPSTKGPKITGYCWASKLFIGLKHLIVKVRESFGKFLESDLADKI